MYFEIGELETTNALASRAQGRWYVSLKSDNHQTILVSEGYVSKQACLHAIDLCKGTNLNTPVLDRSPSMRLGLLDPQIGIGTSSAAALGISSAAAANRLYGKS